MSRKVTTVRTVSRRRSTAGVLAGALLSAAVALGACSSDGSEGADAPRRTTTTTPTTTAGDAERTTTTAAGADTTTSAAPTTPTTLAPGSSSTFRGSIDGQDGIEVTFTRGAAALTDVRADGLELTCQPLEGGDAETTTVDVAIAQVPLGSGDLVEHTQADAPYEPTLSGSFTAAGAFAGALSLSGQRDGFACGGEFTFLATPA